MKAIGIIPARMASSRFPNKPLAPISGMPMIGHVYFRSKQCRFLDAVYIATCDREIEQYSQSIGAPCVMTSDQHQRASERSAEAMTKIEKQLGKPVEIVMMIQGDEPLVDPDVLDSAVKTLRDDPKSAVVNLMTPIRSDADFEDPNAVKVVVASDQSALYFSREPIPSRKKASGRVPMLKQLGLIAFRRDALIKFIQLTPTPLEEVESVDMLRFLEHGMPIRMLLTEQESLAVDTPRDLERVQAVMNNDRRVHSYLNG
jgi:3-deoxy-manno-octulosonate cytidylyltransferase (CMP-KDO synthetase)